MSIWDFRQAIEAAIPAWAMVIPFLVLIGALGYRKWRDR